MAIKSIVVFITRVTCLAVGAAAAGVGCYASYAAAAAADAGYLMVAAPVVALAACLIPCFFERAMMDRQWVRALALFLIWVPCAAVVFCSAVERNHLAKAGAEAERAALRTSVARAEADLREAKKARDAAVAEANKTRGLDAKACKAKCQSARANETAAKDRIATAEKAVAASDAKALVESKIKAPDWLLPLALDVVGMVLVSVGFNLGHARPAQAPAVETVPSVAVAPKAAVVKAKDPKRVAAAKKAAETRRRSKAVREAAQAAGKLIAIAS